MTHLRDMMIVRFRCYHCQHLFGIEEEGADRDLDCPSCGRSIHIPRQNGLAGPARMRHPAADKQLVKACGSLSVAPTPKSSKEKLRKKSVSLSSALKVLGRITPPETIGANVATKEPASVTRSNGADKRLRFWGCLAVAYTLLCLLGTYWGSGNTSEPELIQAEVQQSPDAGFLNKETDRSTPQALFDVTGRIRFRTEQGQLVPDVGALMLFLPESSPGGELIPAITFQQFESGEAIGLLQSRLENFGGTIAVTDSAGEFLARLTEPGRYYAVLLSAQSILSEPQVLNPEWEVTLENYFSKPEGLTAVRRVHLEQVEVEEQPGPAFDIDLERSSAG
ncbi:MAG: hypothetical protein R3C11_23280 [Planctomycetaceae bacterium]